MATKVMMEALSPTMEEGRLAKWLKNVGDVVKNGDVLAEVETDKAIMELVARGDGVLRARLLDEGATCPVGQTIGVIAKADEDIRALLDGAATSAPGAAAAPAATTTSAATSGSPAPSVTVSTAPTPASIGVPSPESVAAPTSPSTSPAPVSSTAAEPVRSSPLARRLASERGIPLAQIAGSGPGGRIIRRDIETAAKSAGAASPVFGDTQPPVAPAPSPSVAAATPASAPASASASASAVKSAPAPIQIDGDYKDVALTQMRKTIARRLSESIGPVPTFYLTAEIDMTRVNDLREAMAATNELFKASINDIVLKAVATALLQHPECNAHWLGDHIRYFSRVHLGMAVATDDGLIVPVIADAHTKGLGQIGKEARELAKRARERRLTPAEYTGSTFSVSNLGMFGIDQFTAIINPPEVAILAIGATEVKPVWQDGAWVPRRKMRITMSCDHRVIDGAVGARFLTTLTQVLENPLRLVY